MTVSEPGSEYSASRELVRTAAKWLVAGLGGIGIILVAGSQLSSIGALPGDSPRLYLSIGGVVVGLLAILWAMWRVIDVLAPSRWAFEDLVKEWEATDPAKVGQHGLKHWRSSKRHPVGRFMRDHQTTFGNMHSPVYILSLYEESEPDRDGLDDLVTLMDTLLDKAATVSLQARFRTLRRQIASGVILGAAGIILFAWAANPPPIDNLPPSLQNADLSHADLRGASMGLANMTGANFSGANLEGSDFSRAKLEGATWSDTICPDGTNSDSRIRIDPEGKMTDGTCEGHLSPAP